MQDIQKKVYATGKGNLEDTSRQGSIYHTRGVVYGIVIVEAIRKAQEKFGKGKVMTPEQVRWGLEHLDLSEARIKELGAAGMFPPIKTSCADHEGSGMVRFQQWDGKGFKALDAVHGRRQGVHPQDGRRKRRQVRRREEDHAARLRQGGLIRRAGRTVRPGQFDGRVERRRSCRRSTRYPPPGATGGFMQGPRGTLARAGIQRLTMSTHAEPSTSDAATVPVEPTYLSVNNIEVIYDHVILVLKGVSLEVPEGGVVALLGANGAGKSTTLKSISNLLRAERGDVTKGTIEFKGQRVDRLTTNELVRMGVCQVMEGRHCFQHLTVEENLLTGAFTRKVTRAELKAELERVYHYFPRLKQRRTSQSGYTSGGEQQMTAVGRALMARPSMILLDEPSMGLAPQIVEEIFEIVRDLNQKERVSFLLAEQNTMVALRYANYGYILENGRVVMDGKAQDLAQNEDVKEFYLGLSTAGRKSFRDVKHYRRRKRWLA